MVVVGESVVAGIPFDLRPEMFSGEFFPSSPSSRKKNSDFKASNK
jgi:hypothetical protein